ISASEPTVRGLSLCIGLLLCSLSGSEYDYLVPQGRKAQSIGRARQIRSKTPVKQALMRGWGPHDRGLVSGPPRSRNKGRFGERLITGQEGSPPWSCLRQRAPLEVLCAASSPSVCSLTASLPCRPGRRARPRPV